MKLRTPQYAISVACILALAWLPCVAADRQIAITIDNLPAGAANWMSAAEISQMTAKLLTPLREQKIPAVGFVNEKKLYKTGEVDERIKALNVWLDSGFELGNHTFSHASLNRVGLKAWEEDVIQGETVTRMLLTQHNLKLRYFRHPYLDTGRDLQTRREADHISELLDVIRKRGYRFITLEEALSDQAYGLPDDYIGEEGTGWLDHWAITRGQPPQNAPVFPQWVIDRSKALPPHPQP